MRTLIILVVGLLSVGCGNSAEKKVLGEYEFKHEGDTYKHIYLENGVIEWYINGKKYRDDKWSISNGEMHIVNTFGIIEVFRINKDSSITEIAKIEDGKRTDYSKENHYTLIKIK